jgi:hypothetical protein
MAFYLLKTDFNRYTTPTKLDGITESTDSVWQLALSSVIETVSSYLRFRYDTDKEFILEDHVLADTYVSGARVVDSDKFYTAIQDVPTLKPITDVLFWKESDFRNPAMVDINVVLVLYAIYSRINGSEIPNWIQVLYDGGDPQQRAGKIGYLKEIRKGSVQINLALLADVEDGTDQSGNSFAYGSAVGAVKRNTSI